MMLTKVFACTCCTHIAVKFLFAPYGYMFLMQYKVYYDYTCGYCVNQCPLYTETIVTGLLYFN